MAKRFFTDVNLKGNQLLEGSLEQLASDPTPFLGRMYYNTTVDAVRYYDGSVWVTLGEGGVTSLVGTANEVEVSGGSVGALTVGLPASISVDVTGALTGNASTATTLETARAISLIGGASGSASFDGSSNISIPVTISPTEAVTSITGTANEIDVSASVGAVTVSLPTSITVDVTGDLTGNADTATTLATSRNIVLSGAVSGSASFDGSANANITTTVVPNSVALGTDTTGDYVATITGTANEIEVTGAGTEGRLVTVGLPPDVIITNSLLIQGALTVSGSATYVNTEIVTVDDNIVLLNSNATGAPTQNGGLEIERGDEPNVQLVWNETTDVWEATASDGSTYFAVMLAGDATSGDISDFAEAAQDAVGGIVSGSNSLAATYNDGANTLTFDTTLATTSYLSKTSGLAVDKAALETALTTDGYTKKYSVDIGDAVATSYAVTHNFGTRDVVVNVYDNASYDTVEVDVVRTDTNNVTVSFTVAPASNAFRVVVVG